MTVRELTDERIIMRTATLASMTSDLDMWKHAVGRGTCALVEAYTPQFE